MWKDKAQEKKKRKEKHTLKGQKKNGRLIFLLSVGDKWEILKLIFQCNKFFDET